MNSQSFQMYVRIALYQIFGGLAGVGITTPENTKAMITGIVGIMANLVWTVYGTRLNGLLEQVKEKTGVQSIDIKVDPELLPPAQVNLGTSNNITAQPQ